MLEKNFIVGYQKISDNLLKSIYPKSKAIKIARQMRANGILSAIKFLIISL